MYVKKNNKKIYKKNKSYEINPFSNNKKKKL